MHQICPESSKIDLLLIEESDPADLEDLMAHVENCETCLNLLEKRNRFFANSLFDPGRSDQQASLGDTALGAIERIKRMPAVDRENRIGHFRIIRKLGEGGMGQVYECLDEKLNRRVAVKWIKLVRFSAEFLQRLEKEARIHARLNHANIVNLLEFGLAEGMPYLVMELVDGGTLRDLIRDQKLSPKETAAIMAGVARGVQAAHDEGVLHRDLKPANILLKPEVAGSTKSAIRPGLSRNVPKVTDFGLAKALDQVTQESDSIHLKGTPYYMAPEYIGGESKLSPAADIYSLGVILYELLTGRVPFAGQNLAEVSELIRNQNPIPPRKIQAGVPPDLQTICLKCLEKLPRLRYASAGELAADLERFLLKQPIRARPVGPLEKTWRWGLRNPSLALMFLVSTFSVTLLVVSSILFAYRQTRLRQEAETLKHAAQASELMVRSNYHLIRDKYFRELEISSSNFIMLRDNVEGEQSWAGVKDFYTMIIRQRYDRAHEMIKMPELLQEESEYMVEAFYLAALQTQVEDQDTAMQMFRTAVERAKAIAAKRKLNPLGRFCALNSDNFLGVIHDQRGLRSLAKNYFQDGWDHFRVTPGENLNDARLKKFSLIIGQNLVESLSSLGQQTKADGVRAECEEIRKIKENAKH